MIPNIIHFIFGLKEDFDGIPFSLIHYLAVKSAHDCNNPEVIKFYYKYEPSGEWWEKAKPYLTLVKTEPPTEIFGNPLTHPAHQADILRLEILIKEGGIYLDMDVICINSFNNLLRYDCVLGKEGDLGLCNAVILAEVNSRFLQLWYERYKTFRSKGRDEFWAEHSVKVPMELSQQYPECIHIEDEFSFFWPIHRDLSPIILWDRPTEGFFDKLLLYLKKRVALLFMQQAYCVHLWEQIWWDDQLCMITLEYFQREDTNFVRLFRKYLQENNWQQNRSKMSYLLRPFLKKAIQTYLRLPRQKR